MQRAPLESFAKRVDTLDALELYLAGSPAGAAQARSQCAELEARNMRVSSRLARRIATKRYTREGLRQIFSAPLASPNAAELTPSYDWRDALLSGLLDPADVAADTLEREPELVFYQPTPARVIAELFAHAQLGPSDTLCDLGSGLGHVVILAALLTGARALGVEREPACCEHAQRSAEKLALDEVRITCGDARTADFGQSSVFFLYTPFRGSVLRQVLRRLELLAGTRALRIASFGPCTAELAREHWLTRHEGASEHRELAVFTSSAR